MSLECPFSGPTDARSVMSVGPELQWDAGGFEELGSNTEVWSSTSKVKIQPALWLQRIALLSDYMNTTILKSILYPD